MINQYFKRRQSIAMGILNLGDGGGILVMGPTVEALIVATGVHLSHNGGSRCCPALPCYYL